MSDTYVCSMSDMYVVCGIYCSGEKPPSVPVKGTKWRPKNKLSLTAFGGLVSHQQQNVYNSENSPSKHLLYSVFLGDGVL